MADKRTLPRLHVLSYLKVCERNTDETVGRVVDMTTQGMRLLSDSPIAAATVQQFRMGVPRATGGNERITFDAWVIWCRESVNPGYYDTGIELKDVSAAHIEAIEQFMEESSFTDRWLTLADSRSEEY